MYLKNINEWLEWMQLLHVTDMDLSLERVREVAKRLNLLNPSSTVITVGGTNGKGSCVAGLETIYLSSGYRVGAFTSPILFRHNEYVRIQGVDASDDAFCEAFAKIKEALGEITLTPFEFNALAAFYIFQQAHLDVWILEVGLGGRYDAVNVIAADIAIVASIGIDHVEWLGDTREKIAYEKAGIFRKNKPAICGDFDPPQTLIDCANEIGAPLYIQARQFGFEKKEGCWNWWSENSRCVELPLPKLALQNMAAVLMAVDLLQKKLPVARRIIESALKKVTLPGRIQVYPGEVTQIFDVSHNPAAAEFLKQWLLENPSSGKTHAVFSMLADKDIVATLLVMRDFVEDWHVASLPVKRGASVENLMEAFKQAKIKNVFWYDSIKQAYESAVQKSVTGDRVVVFGSFHTVAKAISNYNDTL
ncbi:MAG: bifunctional tetrahydrofolate synthase/dihydrofolate synthase [Gammaproteobacteria bacterium]